MDHVITNARIFDGHHLTEHRAIGISNGRTEVLGGAELANRARSVLDARGGTLMPGLIDAHLHLLPGAARQSLTFGVTTGIDQFSKPDLFTSILAENHRADVAEIYTSGIGATAPGGHPTMAYSPFPYVTGPDQAASFVADRKAEGSTHLKVLYDDGSTSPMPMPSLDLATVRALVVAAHEAGMLVVAHVTSAAAAVHVVEQGVDVLAHAPFEELNSTQLDAIAAAGTPVIATLAIADGFPDAGGHMPLLTRPHLAARLGVGWRGMLQRQAQRWMPPGLPDFSTSRRNVGELHSRGVPILAGTDAPNPGMVHGASLHRELEHLVLAGLSPVAALQAATSVPAAVFGLTDRGQIRPGARADLLLVPGQPDHDITATQDVTAVWKQGERVDLDAYADSPHEQTGLAALQATNDKILATIQDTWPGFNS